LASAPGGPLRSHEETEATGGSGEGGTGQAFCRISVVLRRLLPRLPADMLCAKLITNMSHKQWRDWVSPNIRYIKVCPDLPVAPD
jgi:hypothetical protein